MNAFFNGADVTELAGLNQSSEDVTRMVKELLSSEEQINRYRDVLDNPWDKEKNPNGLMGLDMQCKLTSMAMEDKPELAEYQMQVIWNALSRRFNTMSRTIAKKHGFETYMKLVGGKIKKADLQIEHKPQD